MYKTKCPACDEDDCLYVTGGVFSTIGMPLEKDGFAFAEAQQVSTEDETVLCSKCRRMFNLYDLMRNEAPSDIKRLKIKGE